MTQAGPTIPKHCQATRKDGQPCRAPALPSGFCFAHDPAGAAERRAARERGGRNKARPRRLDRLVPATLKPVLATLLAALDEVRGEDGRPPALTPAQASALASLAGAAVKVYQVGVLEERIAALEAAGDDAGARTA